MFIEKKKKKKISFCPISDDHICELNYKLVFLGILGQVGIDQTLWLIVKCIWWSTYEKLELWWFCICVWIFFWISKYYLNRNSSKTLRDGKKDNKDAAYTRYIHKTPKAEAETPTEPNRKQEPYTQKCYAYEIQLKH